MYLRIDENGFRTTFTPEQDEVIKEKYLELPYKTLARHIGKSYCGLRYRMKQLGLIVPNEIIEQRILDSRLKKGNAAHNKGKKIKEYVSDEAIARMAKTRFEKGHKPHNALPDYTEVKRQEKRTGRIYVMIKIPGKPKLVYKHVWLWENENGKVKKGYVVIFKDGDPENCVIDNLLCITMQENMLRNSTRHDYPEQLIPKYAKLAQAKKLIKNIQNNG